MSYKCLHDDLDASDRHAALSDFSYRVWTVALAKSDCRARILADAKYLSNHLSPFAPWDPDRVETALQEIFRSGLAHPYQVGAHRYMVFHRAERSCAGGVGRANPKCPPPPASLCACCLTSFQQGGTSGVFNNPERALPEALSTTLSPLLSSSLHVAVQEGGVGETAPSTAPPLAVVPSESESLPLAAGLSADRVAQHLAQTWKRVNGRASDALSSLAKASQAFEMALKAGADGHALEKLIIERKGLKPLSFYDLAVPKPARASPAASDRVLARAREIKAEMDRMTAGGADAHA